MSYRRRLLFRWSRRDRLAVLVVALTVAFLVGTSLLVLAASDQTTAIAAEYGTPGAVERHGSVAAARAAAPPGAAVLPIATATRSDGRRVTVVARTERGRRLGDEAGIALFDADGGTTHGGLDRPREVELDGSRGRVAMEVRPRGETVLSPDWYVAPSAVVERLGATGALVVRPTSDPTPVRGVPLLSALAFFVFGTEGVLRALAVAALGGGLLVGVTIYSVTRMTVRDRLPTIGVVRATGARPRDVLAVFALRGTLLAGVGVALGYAGGVILPNAAVSLAVFLGLPTSLALDVTGRAAWLVGLTVLGTLGVGAVAGALAIRPAIARPPARLHEGASIESGSILGLRLLDRRTLVPTTATLTAFVLFAVLVSATAGAIGPLATTDGATITEPGATHPIASDVPAAYADALRARGIAASPEILAFAARDGRPFVVRGANATAFSRVTDATLVRGRYPRTRSEALLGVDLARTLDLGVGDDVLVGGSTTPAVTEVRVVGTFRAPGAFDDQLLVSLATARHLTGRAPGRVQFVRTSGVPDAGERNGSVGVVDVAVRDRVPANATLEVRVRLRNDGLAERTRSITIAFDGTERTRRVTLARGASRTLSVVFPVGVPGRYVLRAGEVTRRVEVVPPGAIEIRGLPAEAPPGSAPRVRVRTLAGEAAGNASLRVANRTLRVGQDGVVRVPLRRAGEYVIAARRGDATASATVSVVPGTRRAVLAEVGITPSSPGVLSRPTLRIDLDNPWNRTLARTLRVEAPGGPYVRNVSLAPGSEEGIAIRLPRRPPARYAVAVTVGGRTVAETTYRVTGDERIAAAVAEGATAGQSGLGRAARVAFGNLELVLAVIVALAGLMTAGGTTASFARAVHGRRRTIGIHRATGGTPRRVLALVLGDALRIGLLATILALVIGVSALFVFEAAGLLAPFGVRLSPLPTPGIALGIALGALAVAVLGATLATLGLLLAPPASLLAEERGVRSPPGGDVRE